MAHLTNSKNLSNDGFYQRIRNFPLTILTLSLGLVLFLGSYLGDLKIMVSMNDLVDQSLPAAKTYRQLKEDFQLAPRLMTIFAPKEGVWKKEHWDEFENWEKHWKGQDEFTQNWLGAREVLIPKISKGQIIYQRLHSPKEVPNSFRPVNQSPWQNLLTNKSGSEMAIQVQIKDDPGKKKFGGFWPTAVKEWISSLKNLPDSLFHVHTVGPAAFTFYAIKGVSYNMALNVAFLFILILIFKFVFGTWKAGFFLLLTFGWSGLVLHGTMAFKGTPMEILSSGLFTMIVVASLEDYLFILHEQKKGIPLPKVFENLFWPSLFTSLTTVIGFGSLSFSDVDIISRFGKWAAYGAIIEWIATFFLLPSLLKVFKIKSLVDINLQFPKILEKVFHFLDSLPLPRGLSLSVLITYPLAFLILINIQVSDSPLNLFPKNHVLVKDFEYLKSSRGWEGEASLTFPLEIGPKEQIDLLGKIKILPNIALVEDYFSVQEYITHDDKFDYKKALLVDFRRHPVYQRYRGEFLSYRHLLYFKNTDFHSLKTTMEKIHDLCKGKCQLVGEIISYNQFMEKVPLGLFKSLGFSIVLVGIFLLFIGLKFQVRRPFLFMLGSLWGPSVLLILMWLFSIRVNFLSCVFICMMVGLTGDNGIQFLYAEKLNGKDKGIVYHQKCAFQSGLLLALSCLFFLFSYFSPPREFGPLLGLGFLFSLYGDIWITKSLNQKT